MFSIQSTDEQRRYAREMINAINFGNRGGKTKEDGNNGTKEEQFIGVLGEIILFDFFGKPRPTINEKQKDFGDNGVDIIIGEQKIDIKTMGRNCEPKKTFINNLHGDQVRGYYKNDAYIFTSYNKKTDTLTICGWVTKEEFFERADFYPKGTVRKNPKKEFTVRSPKGLYEIKNEVLNDFYGMESFVKRMNYLNLSKKKKAS
jgi:hypothetical protein